MTSTTSPRLSETDGSPGGSRHSDQQIGAQRQPNPVRTPTTTDRRAEEARQRSEAVQAAIDIAAGW